MRISAISDVHIKSPHDEADKLLLKFLDHPLVKSSDIVLLLGDIFDLMTGAHPEYIQDFSHIFSKMDELHKSGKEVLFFEGNHDIQLKKLFSLKWPKGEIVPHQYPVIREIEGKTYYFSHGDEHEVDNLSYQRYKKFILTPQLRFISDYIMPYSLLNFIGIRASKMSRKKGSKVHNEDKVRERFRSGVQTTTQGKYDFILGGHSHAKDIFQLTNSQSTYVNNGYALRTQTFLHINDHQLTFESLA